MFHGLCQRALRVASAFLRQQKGSILIYTGAFMAIGVGGAAFSIDIGRIVLLRTQMQNRADAGALAGAAQLDANIGAVERADFVIRDSMTAFTTALQAAGEPLPVLDTFFYLPLADSPLERDPATELNPKVTAASTDYDKRARFVRVDMQRKTLSFFYAPAMNLLTGQNADNSTILGAHAVAMSDPYICKTQPLMICDPYAQLGTDPTDKLGNHIGASIMLKQPQQGGGTWTPGNFGLLDLPEDAAYSGGGATAVEQALNALEPQGCYGVNATKTAPGSMVQKVRDGVNVRFGLVSGSDLPAENVIQYKPDRVMDYVTPDALYDSSLIVGDGVWDLAGYWSARHPGVPMPTDLAGATRFQIYLFELGVTFYRKPSGKTVKFTLDASEIGGGWISVNAANYGLPVPMIPVDATTPTDTWVDGEPEQTAAPANIGYKRRLLNVAILDCTNYEIAGSTTAPGSAQYISIFLTQMSPAPPDARIVGEIVQALTPNTSFEFHGNVRLIE